ncbi:MAG: polyisoprenoid-binding protein [Anaerolineae bacterium CG2_30_64_16]|nr:MAG: polyisoprenoid-binding protein [Anaerolineae bacterium CG2_30_64_16]
MAWQIDPAHTRVTFSARHMMISNVHGQFATVAGAVEFDEQDPVRSAVDVQIEAASIDTGEPQRDAHLKSADFLNVEVFPYIHFKSTRVEQIDESHGRIIGDLAIRDVTKEVVLDVEYAGQAKSPWGMVSAGFTARTKINRKDFGLTWNVALETGGWLVGDTVNIAIEVEIIQQG